MLRYVVCSVHLIMTWTALCCRYIEPLLNPSKGYLAVTNRRYLTSWGRQRAETKNVLLYKVTSLTLYEDVHLIIAPATFEKHVDAYSEACLRCVHSHRTFLL